VDEGQVLKQVLYVLGSFINPFTAAIFKTNTNSSETLSLVIVPELILVDMKYSQSVLDEKSIPVDEKIVVVRGNG
jgi:hypothetical protein